MNTNPLKFEQTPAGLKVYYKYDEQCTEWLHIKTVKCKYEPVILDLLWIRDYKKILPTPEERMHLEMKYQLYSLEYDNEAQREFINRQEPVCIKKIELRDGSSYHVVVMSEGIEVRCSGAAYTVAVNYGIPVQTVKRTY